MSSFNVLLDGVDMSTLGVSLLRLPDLFSAPDGEIAALGLPEFDGEIELNVRPRMGARVVTFMWRSIQVDAATAETVAQTLKDALSHRRVKIAPGTSTTRAVHGTLLALRAEHEHPLSSDGWFGGTISFRCADPYLVDDTETVISAIAAERVAIQVGTGPTYPYVQIVGATSGTVTLTMRDHAGTSLGTLALSTSLAAEDAYVIETVNGGRVWLHDAGVITSAMSLLTAGYTFPVFEPRHGDRASSSWPTLETDKGTLNVRYARRWR